MSARNNDKRKQEIMARLQKSQVEEDFQIDMVADSIKNITTGMDIVRIDINSLNDAPEEWNFFTPLSDGKMKELIESIEENGLLSPVILWEQDGRYMILAGHNRVRAFKMLYEQTGDEKYSKIHAYIKKTEELSEEDAKAIIIDTNFVQRQLSTYEKTKSIVAKYKSIGRKKRNSDGKRTAEVIAEQYNLKIRQIYNYYKLDNLIPEFMERIDNGLLSLREGLKLAELSAGLQKKLFDNYLPLLSNKKIAELNIKNGEDDIIEQLKQDNTFVNLTFRVFEKDVDEFKVYVEKWFNEKNNL